MATASTMVRDARRERSLTQRELAGISGVPQASISRIEQGETMPRVATLESLLTACGWELHARPSDLAIVDRGLIRERLALDPAERSRLGVDEALAMLRLTRARLRRTRT